MKFKLFFARTLIQGVLGEPRVNPNYAQFRQEILGDDQYELIGEFETESDLFNDACGEIFERFNIGDMGGKKNLRSMSGGDYIELEDGTRVLYRSIGFRIYPIVGNKQPYNCGNFILNQSGLQ